MTQLFVNPQKKIYPITPDNISSLYPFVSLPTTISDDFAKFLGLSPVAVSEKPALRSMTEYHKEIFPTLKDGKYFQTWIIVDGVFDSSNTVRFEKLKTEKKSLLAEMRWNIETGGIVVNGINVKTDRESQSQLASAVMIINEKFSNSINWKCGTGWVNMSATEILTISKAVSQHVQGCFNIEKMHSEKIDELQTVEEVSSYDISKAWPSNTFNF